MVNERAHFRPTDSFDVLESTLGEDNIARSQAGLARLPEDDFKLSETGLAALRTNPDRLPRMFQRLDRALGLGHPHTLEDFFCDDLACSRDLSAGRKCRLLYLLHLDGFDLRGARLAERKHLPEGLLAGASERILYTERPERDGAEIREPARALALKAWSANSRTRPVAPG